MSDIELLLIASASHATSEERKTLTEYDYNLNCAEEGWFFYVGADSNEALNELDERSEGLAGVIRHALKSGCRYVLLDPEGRKIPGVATYDRL